MRFPVHALAQGTASPGGAAFDLTLDPGLLAFQGHFPGDPILPGVVQVDWAVHFATLAFGPLGAFQGVEHLKFMDPIRPGEAVRLTLDDDPARGALRFQFTSPKGRKASGTLRFSGRP